MTGLEPLYTAAEMRAAEEAYDGPTIELMERAGRGAAEILLERYPDARRFAVWCGGGANGGDGYVVARILHEARRVVEIVLTADPEKVSGDAAESLRRAREIGIPIVERGGTADVVVDAVFGTGFAGKPRPDAAERIEQMNGGGVPVVSLDIPSGVDASTGRVPGAAVEAELTVTFHGRKVGLAVGPGRFHAGEIQVVDIGVSHGETELKRVGREVLASVPRRGPRDNKYTSGSVVVVGGSAGMTGAPVLTSEAAMRAGAGYVRAIVPETLAPVFAGHFVEVTTTPAPCDPEGRLTAEAAKAVLDASERAHAVAIGPGLGRSAGTQELVQTLLETLELPVVLDGDGLWALAGHLDWVFTRHAPTLLTPHSGELSRLLDRDSGWVEANRLDAVAGAADDVGAAMLLKGADSLVAAPGRGVLVCDLGSPGLASAGTGDVLTGIAAAFLAKGMDAQLAGAAAAAAGGAAAAHAAERGGEAGMIARDVIGSLSSVLSGG